MGKKKEDAPAPGAPMWVVTYGDMMSLLLVFFILLVSFSTMELEKFKAAAASLKGSFSVLPYQAQVMPSPIDMVRPTKGEKREQSRKRERAIAELRKIIREEQLGEVIKISENQEGVHISIGDPALFDSGRDEIKPEILPVLNQIVQVVSSGEEIIRVEGHTDNVPIHNEQFRNNWELSINRALSVISYIQSQQEHLDPSRLRPVGGGEFHPVASNNTPEGRALNRRVDIYIDFRE